MHVWHYVQYIYSRSILNMVNVIEHQCLEIWWIYVNIGTFVIFGQYEPEFPHYIYHVLWSHSEKIGNICSRLASTGIKHSFTVFVEQILFKTDLKNRQVLLTAGNYLAFDFGLIV